MRGSKVRIGRRLKELLERSKQGQGTVEAAFLIPVVFIGLLLLIQPGVILYDRIIMGAAAAEACRLLATKTDAAGDMDDGCEAFVRHRLGAVPPYPASTCMTAVAAGTSCLRAMSNRKRCALSSTTKRSRSHCSMRVGSCSAL